MKSMDAVTRRVRLMIGRAIVRLVDDAKAVQEMQVDMLADETADGVERMGQYGLTSNPPAGSEAIVLHPGGTRSHAIAIAVESRKDRPTGLKSGDAMIYDNRGQQIWLTDEGIFVVAKGDISITAEADISVTAEGDITVRAETAMLDAETIILGGTSGGEQVARVGDDVDLTTGKILTGSAVVRSA